MFKALAPPFVILYSSPSHPHPLPGLRVCPVPLWPVFPAEEGFTQTFQEFYLWEGRRDTGIMDILGSFCTLTLWKDLQVGLITLTNQLHQAHKHSKIPGHPSRERTEPVLPKSPEGCLCFSSIYLLSAYCVSLRFSWAELPPIPPSQ